MAPSKEERLLTRVVASVIEVEGKLLVCQRPSHKRHGGLWEFPGGKIEFGESDFAAVERELDEELGVRVRDVGAVEFSVHDPGSAFVIEFLSVAIDGEPQALEHEALRWVSEEGLLGLALAPSDRRYAEFRVRALPVKPRSSVDEEFRPLLDQWGQIWGLPKLASGVSITYSPRLRKSLGRCRPATGRITLSAMLQEATPERRAEVLCHEAAHVAAYRLHGRATNPHGAEWEKLVRLAGFQPSVRSAQKTESERTLSEPPSIFAYEHRCPVCQSVRFARRPVARWRCAECLAAGLPGELVINRRLDRSPNS